MGSNYCTAPEVELNMRMTPFVDVFNAGCCLYHILSNGYFPFGSRYVLSVCVDVCESEGSQWLS